MIPVPRFPLINNARRPLRVDAHHGNLTDQFRKTAARPSKDKSVTIALPLLKKSPPTAGSKANASGTECQCEGSWLVSKSGLVAFGSNRSSVEDLMEFLALSTDSENVELRRCLKGFAISAKVEARPKGL